MNPRFASISAIAEHCYEFIPARHTNFELFDFAINYFNTEVSTQDKEWPSNTIYLRGGEESPQFGPFWSW